MLQHEALAKHAQIGQQEDQTQRVHLLWKRPISLLYCSHVALYCTSVAMRCRWNDLNGLSNKKRDDYQDISYVLHVHVTLYLLMWRYIFICSIWFSFLNRSTLSFDIPKFFLILLKIDQEQLLSQWSPRPKIKALSVGTLLPVASHPALYVHLDINVVLRRAHTLHCSLCHAYC